MLPSSTLKRISLVERHISLQNPLPPLLSRADSQNFVGSYPYHGCRRYPESRNRTKALYPLATTRSPTCVLEGIPLCHSHCLRLRYVARSSNFLNIHLPNDFLSRSWSRGILFLHQRTQGFQRVPQSSSFVTSLRHLHVYRRRCHHISLRRDRGRISCTWRSWTRHQEDRLWNCHPHGS